jgi:hypothetical protein
MRTRTTTRADDFDTDPRPRTRRRRGAPRWAVGLIVGLSVLGLAGVGAGVAVWWHAAANNPRNLILGYWESTDQPPIGGLEFQADGTLVIHPVAGAVQAVKYRFLSDHTLELEVPNPLHLPRPPLANRVGPQIPETLKGTTTILKLTRDELAITSVDGGERHFKKGR